VPVANENFSASDMAWDLTKTMYSWSTLSMLSHGSAQGFYVPGTRWASARAAEAAGMFPRWSTGKYYATRASEMLYKRGTVASAAEGAAYSKLGLKKSWKLFHKALDRGSPYLARQLGKVTIARAAGLALRGITVHFLASMVGGAAASAWGSVSSAASKAKNLDMGGYFPETQRGVTSRQRAVQAINDSRLHARSSIGNEATMLHR